MALVAAGRQAMQRGAQVLGAGVAVVNDWFDRHQAEINALNRMAEQAGEWFAAHRGELAGFATWGTVATACVKADLYAPMSPAWLHIAENADDKDAAALEALILAAYSPGGLGYDALRDELTTADVLADRREEVEQVLTSLEDGRHYVAICGALPLAEGVLAATHGRWQSRLDAYPLTDRLDKDEGLTEEQVVDLILSHSALEMASNAANG